MAANYLRIPFENSKAREAAKAAGARWQSDAKLWKLAGDVPEALEQFKIEVTVGTVTCEGVIDYRLTKVESGLKALKEDAELFAGRSLSQAALNEFSGSSLAPDQKAPTPAQVQQFGVHLAARILMASGNYELARNLKKMAEGARD